MQRCTCMYIYTWTECEESWIINLRSTFPVKPTRSLRLIHKLTRFERIPIVRRRKNLSK
jgi:hypothetical protein